MFLDAGHNKEYQNYVYTACCGYSFSLLKSIDFKFGRVSKSYCSRAAAIFVSGLVPLYFRYIFVQLRIESFASGSWHANITRNLFHAKLKWHCYNHAKCKIKYATFCYRPQTHKITHYLLTHNHSIWPYILL